MMLTQFKIRLINKIKLNVVYLDGLTEDFTKQR